MVRDDLYITVPSFFRCPISLDVMKSPVSLCTGVTYDRASIQRWLDGGNNTCPATMQVLQTKEFVPNRNLQRLIQAWSDSVQHHDRGVNSDVPSQEDIKRMVKDIENSNSRFDVVISAITRFGEESEENRGFLAELEGFVSMLVNFLGNVEDRKIELIEQVVKVLDLILSKIGDYRNLMELILKENPTCLSSLLRVLQQGRVNSRIGAVKILESIAIDAESKLSIAENDVVLSLLVKSITVETDPSLIEASLSCLTAIAKPKSVKVKLVNLNTIAELRKLLEENGSVSVTEKVLKLLEKVSSCREGRAEMCGGAGCVEAVVEKVLKVSREATEHSVTILWGLCCLFKDQRAQAALNRSNGLTKVLVLMQSDCSPAVRQMAADLLKIFRVNSKSCLSSYDTKTTHIMPF